MNALRRLSAHAGSYLLLAVLALTAAAAVVGVPRLSGTMATDGLRQYVADRPGVEQEIVFSQSGFRVGGWGQPTEDADRLRRVGPDRLDELREAMPPRLRSLVEGNWYHYSLPPAAAEVEASFALVAIGGVTEAAELVAGAWPAETAPPFNTTGDPLAPLFARPAEIALSAAVAEALGLRVGSELLVSANGDVPVIVVGIFIRLKVEESPEFEELKEEGEVSKNPLKEVIRDDWRNILRAFCLRIAETAGYAVSVTFMLSYISEEKLAQLRAELAKEVKQDGGSDG